MEPRGVLLARGPEALQNETDEHNPGSLQKDELAMVASDLGRLEKRHSGEMPDGTGNAHVVEGDKV